MSIGRALPKPPWPSYGRKVVGQSRGSDGVILHLVCGHHVKVMAMMPRETWVYCRECDPVMAVPARGRA